MRQQTLAVLAAIARDVRHGLLETVGVDSELSLNDRVSVVIKLPENTDVELIARAIDLENVEAWLDAQRRVNLGISPYFSTKDVDQTVLAAVKVIHVLLGLHAAESNQPKTFAQKMMFSIAEIMQLRKEKLLG